MRTSGKRRVSGKGDAVQKIEGKSRLSRRAFVGKLAAGAAGAAVALTAGAKGAQALSRPEWKSGSPAGWNPTEGDEQRELTAPMHGGEWQESAAEPVDARPGPTELAPDAPPPWELLEPLHTGSTVAHGWRVTDVSPVVDGSFVLTLENRRGRSHRVHVCRNGGRPAGLVYTKQLDLVVMNGGRGDLPTEEGLAQAVAEVAHVMAANERKYRRAPMVTALLPQSERLKKFGAAAKLR